MPEGDGVACASILLLAEMDKENQEQGKDTPKRINPFAESEEIVYDRELAATLLASQEGPYTMLEMIDSDESEEDETEDGSEYVPSSDCYDQSSFITSQDFAELEFLEEEEEEEEDSSMDEMDEEDDIDPDELSYEELIALGETVGQESRGLSPEEISATLSPYICKSMELKTCIDRCVICQVEYEEGEEVVCLRCEHPFHAACINPWLQIKKVCPICSKEAIKQKTE